MIKNIVFDLGNVLISFRPSDYLERKKYPREIRETILEDIFRGPEWHLLDSGDIVTGEAIDMIAKRSSLKREEIAFIFNKRTDIMFPLELNTRLLPELKKQGYRLFYLSNFPIDIFDEVKNDYYFFRHFEYSSKDIICRLKNVFILTILKLMLKLPFLLA
jgi:FMN phosphatase YigB (HAD superfamily)